MLARTLDVIGTVWVNAALGTGLILIGTGAGWTVGQAARLPPVRLIAWWISRFVLPVLRCRSWWGRAAAIFANNLSILAALLALGRWHAASIVGVAGLGISLGIGLRVLSGPSGAVIRTAPVRKRCADERRRLRIGVALNLLEPPAIILTIGLSLGRVPIALSWTQAWETFALWVFPLTLVAAAGEALWMGVTRIANDSQDAHHS